MFVSNPSRPSGRSYTPLSSSVFLQEVPPSNLTVLLPRSFSLFLPTSLFVGLSFACPIFVCLSPPLFYFPPASFHSRPLGNAIVAATLDTTKSPTIPISTLRRPKLASRLPPSQRASPLASPRSPSLFPHSPYPVTINLLLSAGTVEQRRSAARRGAWAEG